MKHKHAELIHAWADGARIETRLSDGNWYEISLPNWGSWDSEFRVKPVKTNWIQQYRVDEQGLMHLSGVANLRLYFNGDGKLEAAAVLG
jgi:hypothetical protein